MVKFLHSWRQDPLLSGVVKNSSYLFSSSAFSIVLGILQGIFAARLLGATNYGVLAATVIPFASNVNRLLSFRMSEFVVKYLGQYLEEGKKERAASIVKAAGLVEAVTSILAYLVMLALTPLAARLIAHNPTTAPIFALYGLVLVTSITYETATGVLQATRRFNRIAQINLTQNIVTVVMIFIAYVLKGDIYWVMLAYLAGKALACLVLYITALRQLGRELGSGWFHAPLQLRGDWKELSSFAVSTNLHATVNLVVRDSETLLVGALRSTTEGGYFRIALGVINLVSLPIEPFISTTYAEISRTVAQKEWKLTRRLLKRVSAITGLWTLVSGGALALTGYWLVPLLYGAEFRPAYPALLLLLVGYGFANFLNWNRSLLLALGMPVFPLKVSAVVGSVKTVLTFLLVPGMGYVAEAAILSGYFVGSIGTNAWRGWREIERKERLASLEESYAPAE